MFFLLLCYCFGVFFLSSSSSSAMYSNDSGSISSKSFSGKLIFLLLLLLDVLHRVAAWLGLFDSVCYLYCAINSKILFLSLSVYIFPHPEWKISIHDGRVESISAFCDVINFIGSRECQVLLCVIKIGESNFCSSIRITSLVLQSSNGEAEVYSVYTYIHVHQDKRLIRKAHFFSMVLHYPF
jgi:hypothetical protein